jgi:hypothetical protein
MEVFHMMFYNKLVFWDIWLLETWSMHKRLNAQYSFQQMQHECMELNKLFHSFLWLVNVCLKRACVFANRKNEFNIFMEHNLIQMYAKC